MNMLKAMSVQSSRHLRCSLCHKAVVHRSTQNTACNSNCNNAFFCKVKGTSLPVSLKDVNWRSAELAQKTHSYSTVCVCACARTCACVCVCVGVRGWYVVPLAPIFGLASAGIANWTLEKFRTDESLGTSGRRDVSSGRRRSPNWRRDAGTPAEISSAPTNMALVDSFKFNPKQISITIHHNPVKPN